jgi:hypothetical protein
VAHQAKCRLTLVVKSLYKFTHDHLQVYIVDVKGEESPKELTSGTQGATHNPIFSHNGRKVAWLELDQDGYESDR